MIETGSALFLLYSDHKTLFWNNSLYSESAWRVNSDVCVCACVKTAQSKHFHVFPVTKREISFCS